MVSRRIFRAYDIRGVFGRDLGVLEAARIGMALASLFKGDFLVAGDIRASTPVLMKAIEAGLAAAGAEVVEGGVANIGAAFYACSKLGYNVAYVTASHLPPEWNGVKLCFRNGVQPTPDDYTRIADAVAEARTVGWDKVGTIAPYPLLEEYRLFLRTVVEAEGLSVVIDCGNGAACLAAPESLSLAGNTVHVINGEIDPSFPGRGPDPLEAGLKELSNRVVSTGSDFGVAFDGDGDRAVFVDEKGRILTAEQAAAVMLAGAPSGDVVANIECSAVLDELVAERGGRVHRVPVGHTHLIRAVVEKGAVLGVEKSGHFVVPLLPTSDDAVLAAIFFANSLARVGKDVSQIVPEVRPLVRRKVAVSDEEKFRIVEKVGEELRRVYGSVDTTDGVRAVIGDAWGLVRASNTEPVIRITAEAPSWEEAEKLASELERLVRRIGGLS